MRGLYLVCQALATIGFPIIEAVLVNYLTGAENPTRLSYLVALIGVIILHLALALGLLFIQAPAPVFYAKLDEQSARVEELEELEKQLLSQLDLFIGTIQAVTTTYGTLELIQREGGHTYTEVMDFLMEPWKRGRCDIWGYQANSLWNFVLYWVEGGAPNATNMAVKWRAHDDRLVPLNRTWARGVGHIGRCWVQDKMLISPPNFVTSELRDIDCPRREDDTYYNSVLVTPIKIDSQVLGVLVITSSTDGQFNAEEHGPAAELLGMLVAQGLSHCRSDRNLFASSASRSNNSGRRTRTNRKS